MFDKQLKGKIQSFLEVTNGINSQELKNIIAELHIRQDGFSEDKINKFDKCMQKLIEEDIKNRNTTSN